MVRLSACGLIAAVAAPAFAASPDPASLAVPADVAARARALVRQLGSDVFRDRAEASRELEKMGRLALPALVAGRDDPDHEVRLRVELLLPRAEADDLRARVETCLADTDGKYNHDLPGGRRYRLVAGDDPAARDLFIEVIKNKANHELLLALQGPPAAALPGLAAVAGGPTAAGPDRPAAKRLAQVIIARRERLSADAPARAVIPAGGEHHLPPAELPSIALLMLAESFVSSHDLPFNRGIRHVDGFLDQPHGQEAVSGGGKYGTAVRRLALHWLETRDGLNGLETAQRIAMKLNLGGPVVAKSAVRVARAVETKPHTRAMALSRIARYGGRAFLPELTRWFGDGTSAFGIGAAPGEDDVLVRDVALAMAVLATGQDPKDYGLEVLATNPQMKFAETNYRFPPEDAGPTRSAAMARWREWESGQHAAAAGGAAAEVQFAGRYPAEADGEKQKPPGGDRR
jgi:hypothetical protein